VLQQSRQLGSAYASRCLTSTDSHNMTHAQFLPALAVLAVVHVVTGAYTCQSGYNTRSGTPLCAGAVGTTCTTFTCCEPVPTCASSSAAWVVAQALGQGCAKDSSKMFFDTKKMAVEVKSSAEGDVKAACCTAYTNAKCSDWQLIKGSCPSGKDFVGTNSASSEGDLTTNKYREMCCVAAIKKCSSYSVAWVLAQALGQGCAKGNSKMFFDTKKMAVTVKSSADGDVKAACCTALADAKCSDWAALKSCASGTSIVGTNSAPTDSSDGKDLSQKKFREICCKTPMKCADYTVATEASRSISQATVSIIALAGVLAAWVGA